MSINAVTYLTGNTTFETGMVKRGTVGFNVKPTLTGSFKWWNKVDATSTQYLIFTDSFTTNTTTQANAIPTCWSTPNLDDQSFINVVNTIPERVGLLPFTSYAQAYNWLTGTNKYVVLKDEYDNIVTDGLVLNLDAGWYDSYPGSGTVWTDLTERGNNVTLVNTPSSSNDGQGSLLFDGTDEWAGGSGQCPQVLFDNDESHSFSLWIKKNGNNSGNYTYVYDKYGTTRIPGLLFILNTNQLAVEWWAGFWVLLSTGLEVENGQWNFVTVTINAPGVGQTKTATVYLYKTTGLVTATVSSNTDWNAGTNGQFAIGKSISNTTYFNGNVASVQTYNRVLSALEVQQNYNTQKYRFGYTDPFTTNGLVLYWDAANPASYPGTGSTIYDLSGGGWDGTLYNGVGYSSSNGGVLVFDGVDDFAYSEGPNLSTSNSTVIGVSRYVTINQPGTYPGGRIINARYNNWLMGHWNTGTRNYFAQGWVSNINEGPSDTNFRFYATLNNYSSDSWSMYVNDSLFVSNSAGANGPNAFTLGRYGTNTSEYSNSQFGLLLVYNRILNTTEMTQIYNYFKGRYGV